ncbi:MAG: class I SAM-dependent methyltransferase [Gemmatimonadota bacterium]
MGSAEIQGDMWGKTARDWAKFQEPMSVPLWDAMLESGKVGKDSRICDVGCGGGGASLLATERGARVGGLDATEALIDIARERIPDADFRVGDMEDLPFADRVFDAVITPNSIQYSENRVGALREMERGCDIDGRVVVGLWGPPSKVEFRDIFQAMIEAMPEPPPGKGPFELSEPGVLAALVEGAGLNVVGDGEVQCPFAYQERQAQTRHYCVRGG